MAVIRRFSRPGASNPAYNFLNTSADLINHLQTKEKLNFPLDVVAILKLLDIDLVYMEFSEEISGLLRKQINGKWEIVVNKGHHPNRRRFTIAHEIAHYCLHRKEKDTFQDETFFRGTAISPQEYAANQFAGELLMPEDVFRKEIKSGRNQIEELANFFGVSALAVRVRAKQLGMEGHGL